MAPRKTAQMIVSNLSNVVKIAVLKFGSQKKTLLPASPVIQPRGAAVEELHGEYTS
jgi:hypothetical protein